MMVNALRQKWPEYLMETAEMGVIMVPACIVGVVFEYPGSHANEALTDPVVRRILIGMAMGLTDISIIYSRWGIWNYLRIYFTAPLLGMLLAAEGYIQLKGVHGVLCAKLHNDNHRNCVFKCNYGGCSQTVSSAAIWGVS